MSVNLSESLPLARFIYDEAWTPLLGAYLYPLTYIGQSKSLDPNDYLEVLTVIDVEETDVAVTRGGGLFVRNHGEYGSEAAIDSLVRLLNTLLCEFALHGHVSHPITDMDIQHAKLIGRHASIAGGWGAYGDRTWGPYALLAAPTRDMATGYENGPNDYWPVNFYWVHHFDPGQLEGVQGVPKTRELKTHGINLPSLVVAAAYHASRHSLAETIVSSWIVSESILGSMWREYVKAVEDAQRRNRLRDYRTYTANEAPPRTVEPLRRLVMGGMAGSGQEGATP